MHNLTYCRGSRHDNRDSFALYSSAETRGGATSELATRLWPSVHLGRILVHLDRNLALYGGDLLGQRFHGFGAHVDPVVQREGARLPRGQFWDTPEFAFHLTVEGIARGWFKPGDVSVFGCCGILPYGEVGEFG